MNFSERGNPISVDCHLSLSFKKKEQSPFIDNVYRIIAFENLRFFRSRPRLSLKYLGEN